jgi:hypothetical protein
VLPQAAAPAGGIGVLMLDTCFPRLPGDIGRPDAFGPGTLHAVVPGAWPQRVVASAARLRAGGLAPRFVAAARELAAQGVRAITTSCGFLVLLQQELQAAVAVPVVTSSLLQLPALLAEEARVGVLTISAERLGSEHLLAAGVPRGRLDDVVVQGIDAGGEFARAILGNDTTMDVERARADVVAAARALQVRAPGLRHVVLECTNLPPHAEAVRAATGWRLWSLLDDPRLAPWAS